MPISVKRVSSKINVPVTFTFDATVSNFVVGLAYWKFTYRGGSDNEVKSIDLSVLCSNLGTQVQATARGSMRDRNNAYLDPELSEVRLVCIAETVEDDRNIAMCMIEGVPSDRAEGNLPLPGGNLAIAAPFLKGFAVAYPDDDHHVYRLELGTGYVPGGVAGQIAGYAKLADHSSASGSGTFSGGLVVTNASHSGLLVHTMPALQTYEPPAHDFGVAIKEGGAILQSMRVQYGRGDHHVYVIGGGCSGCSIDGSKLTMGNARAFMADTSGSSQSDAIADTHVVMTLFAVPA
jgi:hypothetical protein